MRAASASGFRSGQRRLIGAAIRRGIRDVASPIRVQASHPFLSTRSIRIFVVGDEETKCHDAEKEQRENCDKHEWNVMNLKALLPRRRDSAQGSANFQNGHDEHEYPDEVESHDKTVKKKPRHLFVCWCREAVRERSVVTKCISAREGDNTDEGNAKGDGGVVQPVRFVLCRAARTRLGPVRR